MLFCEKYEQIFSSSTKLKTPVILTQLSLTGPCIRTAYTSFKNTYLNETQNWIQLCLTLMLFYVIKLAHYFDHRPSVTTAIPLCHKSGSLDPTPVIHKLIFSSTAFSSRNKIHLSLTLPSKEPVAMSPVYS